METNQPKAMAQIVPKVIDTLTQTTQQGSKPEQTCTFCGKTVTRYVKIDGTPWFKCRDCLFADEANEILRAEERKAAKLECVPLAFRHTQRDQLPHPELLDRAMLWKFGPRGLLLHGETGAGKSRIAWEVAKREISSGRHVRPLTALELARYPAMFMRDDGSAEKLADEMARCEILLLDDVFKAKQTERVEELIFAVIDERGAWERPCIITLNDTGDTLKDRLSSDRGPALIRRLRDYCDAIIIG